MNEHVTEAEAALIRAGHLGGAAIPDISGRRGQLAS
jgi:hypothetical protein